MQVNTGEEAQKAGVAPAEADAFIAECRGLGLDVAGLMCIPPADEEPSPHFALLAKIAAAVGDGVVTSLKFVGPVGPSWRKGRYHVPGRGPRDTYG